MGVISMKALLEAGVHFGHQTRRWNPKMGRYIYTSRNGIHIIDLQKSSDLIDIAYKALFDIAAEGGNVLFVGTKKQSQDPVKEGAIRSGQFYVNQRWLGGTLTNFKTIKRSIKKLHDLEKMESDGTFEVLPKKEVIGLRKDMARLEKFLGGIKEMKKMPKAIFIIDPRKERNAILEARKLHIPVFGIVDTNCDPDDVDYIIPANDDALRSVRLIVNKMADAVTEANGGVIEPPKVIEKTASSRPYIKPGYNNKSQNRPVRRENKPYVAKVTAETKKAEPTATPVVAKTTPIVAKPAPVVVKSTPVVATPTSVVAKPTPVVAKPTPVVVKPTPVVEKPAPVVAKVVKPVAKVAKPVVEAKPTVDLSKKTVADLRTLAKEKGLKGYSKLKKAELIAELTK